MTTLFVYGTLIPGEPAWPLLEPHARDVRPAAVPGRLYDTGRGYPGAVFDESDAAVHGWCCVIEPGQLEALDRFEGDEYVRVEVTTTAGARTLAYAWRAPLDGCSLIPGGRWPIND